MYIANMLRIGVRFVSVSVLQFFSPPHRTCISDEKARPIFSFGRTADEVCARLFRSHYKSSVCPGFG